MIKTILKNRSVFLLTAMLSFTSLTLLAGCPDGETTEDSGTTTPAEDSGTTTPAMDSGMMVEMDAGMMMPPPAIKQIGDVCVSASQCGDEAVCESLYDPAMKVCMKSCDAPNMACSTVQDEMTVQGGCLPVTETSNACVVVSADRGECGDGVGAICNEALCFATVASTQTNGFIGQCFKVCSQEDKTVCNTRDEPSDENPSDVCGCPAEEACTSDTTTQPNANGLSDGLCVLVTTAGDACGLVEGNQVNCSIPQTCRMNPQTGVGSCVETAVGDACGQFEDGTFATCSYPQTCTATQEMPMGVCEAPAVDADAGSLDDDAGSLDDDAGSLDDDAGSLDDDAGSLDDDAGSLDDDAGSVDDDAGVADAGL